MSILVTGGAGYIGSVTVELLRQRGESVVVLDNLVNGHRAAVDREIPFYAGNVGDERLVEQIVAENGVKSCVHFAAFAEVGESVADPAKYFGNNTVQTNALLNALIATGVEKFIFSSTCATYGMPVRIPMDESHPQAPVNPYGWSKFVTERILDSYDDAYGLKFAALRYFNAAGATEKCGEHHVPESHLIPNVLNAAAGEAPYVSVYGDDYDTPDGTCIRDYIHVADLANAHYLALNYLRNGNDSIHLNLGIGRGYSVLEVIEAARRVTGKGFELNIMSRRAGDPDRLIADATRARTALCWRPEYADIETIVASAWKWKMKNPNGYRKPQK